MLDSRHKQSSTEKVATRTAFFRKVLPKFVAPMVFCLPAPEFCAAGSVVLFLRMMFSNNSIVVINRILNIVFGLGILYYNIGFGRDRQCLLKLITIVDCDVRKKIKKCSVKVKRKLSNRREYNTSWENGDCNVCIVRFGECRLFQIEAGKWVLYRVDSVGGRAEWKDPLAARPPPSESTRCTVAIAPTTASRPLKPPPPPPPLSSQPPPPPPPPLVYVSNYSNTL